MLTIVQAIHLSWFVILCCAQLSLVQGADDHDQHATNSADVRKDLELCAQCVWPFCKHLHSRCLLPRGGRWPRAISEAASGRSSPGIERATHSPDIVNRFRERERKRQWRIFESLIRLKGMMGPRNRTHVGENTDGSLSGTAAESLKRRIEESNAEKLNKDPNIRKIITLFPTCPSPALARNKAFRLFFSIIPPEGTLETPVINVRSAVLHLKRKTPKADLVNGNFDVSDNRKYKGKRLNAVDDHMTKWKARIKVYNTPKGETKAFKYFDLDPRNLVQWFRVSILKVVEEWLKTSRRNLGLQLTIVNGRNQTIDPFDVFHDFNCNLSINPLTPATYPSGDRMENDLTSAASIPHLEIVLAKAPQSSAKRIVRHLPNKENACTMIPVLVKLDDLRGKWKDRIIAPKSFQSNVCKGTCHRCRPSSANITQPRNLQSGSDSDGCCEPIKWRALKALLRDDQQAILYSDIPVWAVTKCGCRH